MEIKAFVYYPRVIEHKEHECPICGNKDRDINVIEKCAAAHPRITDIVGYKDWWKDTNVPAELFVKDTHGKTLKYSFDQIMEENVEEEKADETN